MLLHPMCKREPVKVAKTFPDTLVRQPEPLLDYMLPCNKEEIEQMEKIHWGHIGYIRDALGASERLLDYMVPRNKEEIEQMEKTH